MEPTSLHPWKVYLMTSDPYGNGAAPPVTFFQPPSNAAELMAVYEKFSVLADEYTGIPRYMTGDQNVGGAGRTASGMSMLMSNAGKSIKAVVTAIDQNVLKPAIERLYYYNMRWGDDPDLKGDAFVVARGASGLVVKEQAQVRRNEFLNIVLSNPAVAQVLGEEAIADLLRTLARGLDMDVDKIVPPPEVIRARIFQQRQQQLMAQNLAAAAAAKGQPGQPAPGPQGPRTMPGQGQMLMDGAAPTDNFAPQRGA
jgi:hypothetical protein